MPDDELFALAAQGPAAAEPATPQVRRMLQGPEVGRVRAELRRPVADAPQAGNVVARPEALPATSTTTCARRWSSETELFFEAILREDRSILDLLDADFTLRQRAAGPALRHRRASTGEEFRRVQAAGQPRRHPDAGEHPDGDLEPDADLAGEARQVGAGADPRHAAAAAAARRARAGRARSS